MRTFVAVLALCALAFSKDVPDCKCKPLNSRIVCLSADRMVSHVRHIEMDFDRMGNQTNSGGIAAFEITIGKDGKVLAAKALSGHPLGIAILIAAIQSGVSNR